MKIFRYLVYRLYSFSVERDGRFMAICNVSCIITLVSSIQLLIISQLLAQKFPLLDILKYDFKFFYMVSFMIIAAILHYYISSKNRVEGYCDEFKDEDGYTEWYGTFFIIAYIFGSIFFAFLLAIELAPN